MTDTIMPIWAQRNFMEPFLKRYFDLDRVFNLILLSEEDVETYKMMCDLLPPEHVAKVFSLQPCPELPGDCTVDDFDAIDPDEVSEATYLVCSLKSPAEFHSMLRPIFKQNMYKVESLFSVLKKLKSFVETCETIETYQPVDNLFNFWMGFDTYVDKELYSEEIIKGKSVLEIGPLDGSMTSAILQKSPKHLKTVDIHWGNYAKINVFGNAFGYDNLSVELDDFHNISKNSYGKWDVLFAHGILYHSSNPLLILEQLSEVADTIVVGTHTKPRNTSKSFSKSINWKGTEFPVITSPEYDIAKGGPGKDQVFLTVDDYDFCMKELGFSVQTISKRSTTFEEYFYVFIAERIKTNSPDDED